MPIGANILRQHIVEFISDPTTGGIYTDGVRDGSLTSGPWNWVVPRGVCMIKLDAIAAGGGGGAGWPSGTARAGGGGGASGNGVMGMDLHVIPGAQLQITVGAGGSGGVSGGSTPTGGGRTIISGLTRPYWWRKTVVQGGVDGTLDFGLGIGGGGGGGTATATASGGGAAVSNNILGRTTGVNNGTTGLSASSYQWHGSSSDATTFGNPNLYMGGRMWGQGAAAGGAAHTTATTAGGNGGGIWVGGDTYNIQFAELGTNQGNGSGITSNISGSDVSYGGGGSGAHSFMAFGGKGGDGNAPGENGSFGSGGGGGGGSANGGSGGNGYVRFVYWSVD